jgi:hypothetical protein
MTPSVRRLRIILVSGGILVLAVAGTFWVGAVERWVEQVLRGVAAAHLNPTLAFEDLTYRFPRTVAVRGIRLTSPDPDSPADSIEILAIKSLSLSLSEIPLPNKPFLVRRLDLIGPTIRLVRIPTGERSGRLLGYSDLVKQAPEPDRRSDAAPVKLSSLLQVRAISIEGGRAQYDSRDGDPRDGSQASLLLDGISAELRLRPDDAGAYGIEFSLDQRPVFTLALSGTVLADDRRLHVSALSSSLQLAREHDHFLTPDLQKLVAEGDIRGHLKLEAKGSFDLDETDPSHLQASFDLEDASFTARNHRLVLDHVHSRISTTGKSLTIEELTIDAMGGHAKVSGSLELGGSLTGALRFEGSDLQIADLLRGADDPHGVPSFTGLLGFSGSLRGPLADVAHSAEGGGRVTLAKARIARLPVLSTIDDALDRAAEAAMKKERVGDDALSLDFTLDGDHAHVGKIRMNSRWYGLRGHGDVYFDSRLGLTVDGGPIPRLENELGEVGDVMGEITESLLRARVTGTLGDPKVRLQVFRHSLRE